MKPITPEQVKAFIDDLAYIKNKHGILLEYSHDLGIFLLSADDWGSKIVDVGLSKSGKWLMYPRIPVLQVVVSIDPRGLTAHERFERESSLHDEPPAEHKFYVCMASAHGIHEEWYEFECSECQIDMNFEPSQLPKENTFKCPNCNHTSSWEILK